MDDTVRRLDILKVAHRDLNDDIAALAHSPEHDQLLLARLKRQKLRLKDEIAALEDQMIPDIIA